MADTAQHSADAQITTNIIRPCEVDDEQSFSFCAGSEKMETARLVASAAQDHFGVFAACPAQPIYESHASNPTDQYCSYFRQDSTLISSNCKHSKSFGRDHDLAAFRRLSLYSPDLFDVCPADDLFYNGHLLPLYVHYRREMFEGRVSLPQLQTQSELPGTPQRLSSGCRDQFSSSFWSGSPKGIEMTPYRDACSDESPMLEPRIIHRLQQPALVYPEPFGTSTDDAAGQMLFHQRPSFQNRRSSLKLDPAFWVSSSASASPTKDSEREVHYKSSTHISSCFASPDYDCGHRGRNEKRSAKKSQRSSKGIALAYWHKSIRRLLKPLDRLHSKDNDRARPFWFSCKETGTSIAHSVHHMKFDNSGRLQKGWSRNPDPHLRSNQSAPAAGVKFGVDANGSSIWQNSLDKRASELHIGIEAAIAHCKQSQKATT